MKKNITFLGKRNSLLKDRLIIITGIARSGTTLLGKIVASFKDVEYEFEPKNISKILFLLDAGEISFDVAKDLINKEAEEIFFNHIIQRNTNLRSQDDSVETYSHALKEIKKRQKQNMSFDDFEKIIKKNNIILCIKIPHIIKYINTLYKLFDGVKIIHIYRDPLDVANSTKNKGWYKLSKLSSKNMGIAKRVVFKKEKQYFLPLFLSNKKNDDFIQANEYGRSLILWNDIQEAANKYVSKLKNDKYLELGYENLLKKPEEILQILEKFINKERTFLTKNILAKIKPGNLKKYEKLNRNKHSMEEEKAKKLFEKIKERSVI